MKSDQCGDEVVMHLSNPQILTEEPAESAVGATRASSAAVESGRRLLLAARAGDTDAVRQLMAKGAPFVTDWLGTSPLHLAAANNHVETVGVLLRGGVSRDARTKTDRTPLHLAAYAGHAPSVTELLKGGALVDAVDLLRMTALHWAVERGHAETARALLAHGADPRARSKFHKTPLSMAAERAQRGDPYMLRLIEDCLKEREAAKSVDAIVSDRTVSETPMVAPKESSSTVRIQRISDAKMAPLKAASTLEKKQTKPTLKIDNAVRLEPGVGGNIPGGGGGVVGGDGGVKPGVAEALLRRHGITLLPHDDHTTVLSALQSGRTVVLSDAGKLMLKESGSPTTAPSVGGVVLTATPVLAPPPGVKVFTLSSGAKLLPKEDKQPAPPPPPLNKGPTDPADLQQVKLIQMGGATVTTTPPRSAGGGGGAKAGGGAAVRIIMNKQNFRKLIATATRATNVEDEDAARSSSSSESEPESVVVVPERFVRSSSPQYLRSQLLCAHAALHHLKRKLHRRKQTHP